MSNYPYEPQQAMPTDRPPTTYQEYDAAQPGYTQPGYTEPGYIQPGYAQPGYPQPPGYGLAYPQPMYIARPEHPQATTVLVLGILGFFVAITGPIAWYLGNKAKQECASGMYAETDSLRVGRILGIVTTILMIVWFVILVLYIIGIAAFLTY